MHTDRIELQKRFDASAAPMIQSFLDEEEWNADRCDEQNRVGHYLDTSMLKDTTLS